MTKWSKLDTTWTGVSLDTLLERRRDRGRLRDCWCDGGYTTNLPLADLTDGKAWIAYEYDGEPLEPEHGGPVRLVVPHLYFWKSAKWMRGLSSRRRRARLLGATATTTTATPGASSATGATDAMTGGNAVPRSSRSTTSRPCWPRSRATCAAASASATGSCARPRATRRSEHDVVALAAQHLDDDVAVVALQLDDAVLDRAADAAALLQAPASSRSPASSSGTLGDRGDRLAAPAAVSRRTFTRPPAAARRAGRGSRALRRSPSSLDHTTFAPRLGMRPTVARATR